MSKPLPKVTAAMARIERGKVQARAVVLTEADLERIRSTVAAEIDRALRNLSLRSAAR